MGIDLRLLGLAGAVFALAGLGHLAACTTTDTDATDGGGVGGSFASTNGGAANGGAAGTGSGNAGSPPVTGTACEKPILLDGTKPGIATFDTYDGSDITKWYAPLGGDSSTTVLAGPFGYGDNVVDTKTDAVDTFDMVAGYDSTYALRIADSLAEAYGGGMGLWISECLNATSFTGISFWVRGNGPSGKAKFSILMQETTAATPAKPDNKIGTCPGTDTTCVHPSYTFTVTDTWTEIRVPWSAFTGGNAAGTAVTADGRNIWQVQFDIGLSWVEGDGGAYVPVPAAYELVVDTVTFY